VVPTSWNLVSNQHGTPVFLSSPTDAMSRGNTSSTRRRGLAWPVPLNRFLSGKINVWHTGCPGTRVASGLMASPSLAARRRTPPNLAAIFMCKYGDGLAGSARIIPIRR
jgi:hypothetical protein